MLIIRRKMMPNPLHFGLGMVSLTQGVDPAIGFDEEPRWARLILT